MVGGSNTRVIVIGDDTTTFSFSRDKTSTWAEWLNSATTYTCEISEIEKKEKKAQEKAEREKIEHERKIKELQKLDRKFLNSRKR
jgi:hypothetical protein